MEKTNVVVTTSPEAAMVGLKVLQEGGNAVDAAVATAAALMVTEPTGCGLGGDAFFLGYVHGEIHGLNASGPSPRGAQSFSSHGANSINVPGLVAGWDHLLRAFGKRSLKDNLQGAIQLAKKGHQVKAVVAKNWSKALENYRILREDYPEIKTWFDAFAPFGKSPGVGEIFTFPELAETLEMIGDEGVDVFYRGALAKRMTEVVQQYGGSLSLEDMKAYQPRWVKPLRISYAEFEVLELPPNSQGIATLIALNILNKLKRKKYSLTVHEQMEAMKLALQATYAKISGDDQDFCQELLSDEFAEKQADLIGEEALDIPLQAPFDGGTVYLATADQEGNMVSYIQSNFRGFGSGLVIPGTGIALHNRGSCFRREDHPNRFNAGKLPYHTLMPGFLMKNNRVLGPFGVMGGLMQPMGHLQMVINLERGLDVQAAIDEARWRWLGGRTIEVEPGFNLALLGELSDRGHEIQVAKDVTAFGRAQMILKEEKGIQVGCESRADSMIASGT